MGLNPELGHQPRRWWETWEGMTSPARVRREEAMAPHSSIPARSIPRTGESGGLQSIGLPRVRQD